MRFLRSLTSEWVELQSLWINSASDAIIADSVRTSCPPDDESPWSVHLPYAADVAASLENPDPGSVVVGP